MSSYLRKFSAVTLHDYPLIIVFIRIQEWEWDSWEPFNIYITKVTKTKHVTRNPKSLQNYSKGG